MLELLLKIVKVVKVVFSGLALIFALLLLVVVFGGDDDTDSDSTDVKTEEVVQVDEQEQQEVKQNTDVDKYQVQILDSRSDGFATYITGTLVADRDYTYVQILIPCYDADGNKLGDAIANVNNLNKGESWKFEAMSIDTNVASFDINKAEVDAF